MPPPGTPDQHGVEGALPVITGPPLVHGESPPAPADQRRRLLQLLRQEPRGSANRHSAEITALITALERASPANLMAPGALEQLEGVWELRWSSSSEPYLTVGPWLENLQCLAPSQGRGINLLRPPGPLASLAGIAVEALIELQETPPGQRVAVRFRRGGWLGPPLGSRRIQLLRRVNQSFPAWLEITVLDDELRLCRGNAGTVFALLRRTDLALDALLLPLAPAPG